jgi:hypothetical protein
MCASSSRNIQARRRVLSAHLLPHRDRDDINDRPDRGLRAYRRRETAALVCRTGSRILRRYRPNTLVLEAEFATAEGEVVPIDFMPPREQVSHAMRLVVGKRGSVRMRTETKMRLIGRPFG